MNKSNPESTTTTKLSYRQKLTSSALFRPLVVVLLAAIVLGANTVYQSQHPGKYEAARKAADSFLTAYQNCDGQTAKIYYIPFQNGSQDLATYQKQCRPGALHFTYSNVSAGSATDKLEKGKHILSIGYIYSASQNSGNSSKFLVTMLFDYSRKQWTVDTISAAPSAQQPQQQQAPNP
ncbi:MAG: hypothetical protein ABIV43_03180 [Candidatus Saccharimonadales bacterium]